MISSGITAAMTLYFLPLMSVAEVATAVADTDAQQRPNIVFILADDLGYSDCGFNGGAQIKTPHLDRLAADGTVLESFYVQPVCSPTRAALMTGRYPMRYGLQVGVVRPNAQYGLPLEERTLAAALRQAGYRTAIRGKWHLGSFDPAYWPAARGFDDVYGHLFGALDYFTHRRNGIVDWYRDGQRLEEPGYTTHLLAREAVNFIRQQDGQQPFFLYVPFNAVHTPLQVPPEYLQAYPHLTGQRQKVAAMATAMDEGIGQIVAAIQDKGFRQRTLFVFSSDNGGFAPGKATDNGPLRAGKATLYEGGVRACAFATWDGQIPAGKRIDQPLHMVDWYPTLLKLAGAPLDQPLPLDGLDIWPTIAQGLPSPHDEILLNAAPRAGAIRVGPWKIIVRNPPAAAQPAGNRPAARRKAVELYNLAEDVGEKNDLAPQEPDRVAQLRRRYELLAAQAVPPKARQDDAAAETSSAN